MRISRISIVAAAAASMIASGAGFAVASTGAAQRHASSGTEHFYLMTTEPSASKYTIIATGFFTAGGVDMSKNAVDSVKLAGGTFSVRLGLPGNITKSVVNPKTCLAEFAVTFKITLGDGTRAYKGIGGSGTAVVSAIGITSRSHGACNPSVNPTVEEQTITAVAHVHF